MEFYLTFDGKQYLCVVRYRRQARRINARVRSGQLELSAPEGLPQEEIIRFIKDNQKPLLKALQAYHPYALYKDGGYVTIYGQKYGIRVIDIKEKKCALHDQTFFVYSDNVEAVVKEYLKEELYAYCHQRIGEYLQRYFDLPFPKITIKQYKARWGTCYYNRNHVLFNVDLIHFQPEIIDSVIMHELCHFLVPSHSDAFYQELLARMPDYRQRKRVLNKGERNL